MKKAYCVTIFLLACCVIYSIASQEALAIEYFLDSQMGSDQNQGTSPNNPLKSLTKLSYINLEPGDIVKLKRGCEFRGRLSLRGNGVFDEATMTLYIATSDGVDLSQHRIIIYPENWTKMEGRKNPENVLKDRSIL